MARLPSLSGRRIRVLGFILLLVVLVIVYVITAPRATRRSQFYQKTHEALIKARYENDVANAMANAGDPNAKQYPQKPQDRSPNSQDRINDARAQEEGGNGWLENTLKERLRLAELAAKKSADEKWKGVQDAAEKASNDASSQPDKSETKLEELKAEPVIGANAKRDNTRATVPVIEGEDPHARLRAAEVVASQIMDGIQKAARKEAVIEIQGDDPIAIPSNEPPTAEPLASATQASQDDESEELLREIAAAQERQKERLKAEYKKNLKAQEMERQKVEGAIAVEAKWRQPEKFGSAGKKMQEPIPAPEPTTPAELEFQKLLALSPIVIFSKSYCPYSTKAKRILTQAFMITPSPYVVELDQHIHGADMQEFLAERTGRRTVPNVIVAGRSIGGADEVEALWESNKLKPTIKDIAGKRVVGVVENIDIHKSGWWD